MTSRFKLWSELNPKARKELKPDFGFRAWGSLNESEKYKIWKYLESYFFNKDKQQDFNNPNSNSDGYYYEFFGEYDQQEKKTNRIWISIAALNRKFRAQSYAANFLEDRNLGSACLDFYAIFINQSENVVMELFSRPRPARPSNASCFTGSDNAHR